MKSRHVSVIPVVGSWTVVALVGLLLARSMNNAYFSLMEVFGPFSPFEGVTKAWLLAQIIVSVLCLGIALPKLLPTAGVRRAVLASGLCLPLLFFMFTAIARSLSENGVITPSSIASLGLPELAAGESTTIGGIQLTKTSSGLKVKNILDSRTVAKIFAYELESAWVNEKGWTIPAILLWLGLGAGVIRLWKASAGGAPAKRTVQA
jgi:hypothetical protein